MFIGSLLVPLKLFPTWLATTVNMMGTIFQKEQLCLAMPGQYERLLLLSVLIFLSRSILHNPKIFKNPMEYQPERYLKDGKFDPNVMDPECAAFGFGRRSVNSPCLRHISHEQTSSSVFVPEDTSPLTHYTCLHYVFWLSMILNHQLMIREILSSSNPSSPADYSGKDDRTNTIAD